jgi:hypothetical protein
MRFCGLLIHITTAVFELLQRSRQKVGYIRMRLATITSSTTSRWVGVCDKDGGSQWRRLAVLVLLLLLWCWERRFAFVLLSEYTAVLWLLGTDMLQYISSQHDTQTCKTRKAELTAILMDPLRREEVREEWRRLHYEELIRVMQTRWRRWEMEDLTHKDEESRIRVKRKCTPLIWWGKKWRKGATGNG